jgi:hypothetical protein
VWGWADVRCSRELAYICREDQPFVYSYTSAKLDSTYYLDTSPLNALAAEASCMTLGGHLVSYGSAQEQSEVEAAFIRLGGLIPGYHGSYWMGLRASPYPQFFWLDRWVRGRGRCVGAPTLPLPVSGGSVGDGQGSVPASAAAAAYFAA